MPRKEEQAYITENSVFAKRLRELMAERGENQTTLAEKINMRRQTVSLYTTGQSEPLASKVAEIARALDVSADYLLGLREVKSTDITIQGVADYTGLSEEMIINLHKIVTAVRLEIKE